MSSKTFKPREIYSLSQVAEVAPVPGITEYKAYRRLVARDRKKQNILQAIITGEGAGKRIRMYGENVNKLVHLIEAGLYQV